MLTIDGSFGEGGGQILRSSLALSLVTRTPVRLVNIRANRDKPGLRPQHLTGVLAAAKVGTAEVRGAAVGSSELTFTPQEISPGEYHFQIGTAGSTVLVAQTVLPALMLCEQTSRLVIEGGTHASGAPPFDFLERTYLPQLARMGLPVSAKLVRAGFYPNGGGRIELTIQSPQTHRPLKLEEHDARPKLRAIALVSQLPEHVGERECRRLEYKLKLRGDASRVEVVREPRGPGNAVLVEIVGKHVTEVVSAFGKRGKPAEKVADEAARLANDYLKQPTPVGEHLTDQLLLPMALAAGGTFRCGKPSLHTETNIHVIRQFLDVPITCEQEADDVWRVSVRR